MKTTVRLGDLIAGLYVEARKETKNRKIQSLLVGLALNDLQLRTGLRRKQLTVKARSAA